MLGGGVMQSCYRSLQDHGALLAPGFIFIFKNMLIKAERHLQENTPDTPGNICYGSLF